MLGFASVAGKSGEYAMHVWLPLSYFAVVFCIEFDFPHVISLLWFVLNLLCKCGFCVIVLVRVTYGLVAECACRAPATRASGNFFFPVSFLQLTMCVFRFWGSKRNAKKSNQQGRKGRSGGWSLSRVSCPRDSGPDANRTIRRLSPRTRVFRDLYGMPRDTKSFCFFPCGS